MRRSVLANLDDLDPDIRSTAEAAARRAGLRLEDWVGAILADRLARQMPAPAPRQRSSPDDFDAIIARLASATRKPSIEPDERSRTASAIESIAGWIERADERLVESSRLSADSQDRMVTAMKDAFAALKDRLDAVERHVVSERAPPRIEFPIEEAAKALSPLADTLLGLRTDVCRLAERLEQPLANPAIDAIGSQIAELRTALGALATRDEIAALDDNLQSLSRDIEKRPSGNAVMTIAGAIATLHGQVADISDEMRQGVHIRVASEIEGIERKIDRLAESGVDRSVVDFLSSQIVDMRHDLATRAEPRQIERLAIEVTALTTQIAEFRSNQVGRSDFVSLRNALEKVCGALSQSVARQEANDVPERIRGLGEKLDALVNRTEKEPANLEPIAAQLALLTERMAATADRGVEERGIVQARFDQLSGQIAKAIETSSPSGVPLRERFDRLEAGLRQVCELAANSNLSSAPSPTLKALRDEAESIAGRAAKAAIESIRPPEADARGEVAALTHGFAELKALQVRADTRTQQTLRAVHDALESLVARFGDQALGVSHAVPEAPQPADRLEAAVRRLHAAALSQVEEISGSSHPPVATPSLAPAPDPARIVAATIPGQEADLTNVRASFIAAARRASQTSTASPDESADPASGPNSPSQGDDLGDGPSEVNPLSPPSLIERLRKTFAGERRPWLFSIALLILVAGTADLLSHEPQLAPVANAPADAVQAPPAPAQSLFGPSSLFGPAPADSSSVDAASFKELPGNISEALRKAASAGHPAALYEMANRLTDANEPAEAARLFEKAARAGLAPAQERIGAIYERGLGVARDQSRALGWYERAAQAGNLQAMHQLATLLAAGAQGEPDYAGAFRWYGEAAEGGLRDSQFNLGVLLTRGVGTTRNLPRAYQWFDAAARQGDADAETKRDEIAKQMPPPALAAARLLAERWRARPVDGAANKVEWPGNERTAELDPRLGGKT